MDRHAPETHLIHRTSLTYQADEIYYLWMSSFYIFLESEPFSILKFTKVLKLSIHSNNLINLLFTLWEQFSVPEKLIQQRINQLILCFLWKCLIGSTSLCLPLTIRRKKVSSMNKFIRLRKIIHKSTNKSTQINS